MSRLPEVADGSGQDQTNHFTQEQIQQVLAKLKATPGSIRALISSAQGGNMEDLQFIMEAGVDFFADGAGEGFQPIPPTDPRSPDYKKP